MIGAYAIGAAEGFIYVRDEYPLAVKHVTLAIRQAYGKYGLLGKNILDTGSILTSRSPRARARSSAGKRRP